MNDDRLSHFEAALRRSPPANGGFAGVRTALRGLCSDEGSFIGGEYRDR